MNNKTLCEVVKNDLSLNVNYDDVSLCRVYKTLIPLFYFNAILNNSNILIDSTKIYAFESKYTNCTMSIIKNSDLIRPTIMLKDIPNDKVVFMTLFHSL